MGCQVEPAVWRFIHPFSFPMARVFKNLKHWLMMHVGFAQGFSMFGTLDRMTCVYFHLEIWFAHFSISSWINLTIVRGLFSFLIFSLSTLLFSHRLNKHPCVYDEEGDSLLQYSGCRKLSHCFSLHSTKELTNFRQFIETIGQHRETIR